MYPVNMGMGTYCKACSPKPLLIGGVRNWDWSGRCLFPLREMTESRQKRGGESIVGGGGGSKNVFGEGFYGMSPPPKFPRIYPWAHERGTIGQIGVSTGRRCIVLGFKKGHFLRFRTSFSMNVAQVLHLLASLFFSAKSLKMALFGPKECSFLLHKRQSSDKWYLFRPFFLCKNSIWSFTSVSSPSDYTIWRLSN